MIKAENTYHSIGIMSGSSLDGLDIALCKFTESTGKWQHELLATDCVSFSAEMKAALRNATALSGKDIFQLHSSFGKFIGEQVNVFLQKHLLTENIDCIASHGHTVFHFPEHGITTQIGDGAAIAAATGITTICDLRAVDVAHGGTGAPIVPVADKLLFSNYDFCLNLGGIANISAKTAQGKSIIAFDICPCNQLLDFFAAQNGLTFDDGGKIAAQGKCNEAAVQELLKLDFHQREFPKSLDNSFSKQFVIPTLKQIEGTVSDKLRTATAYIVSQIAKDIECIAEQHQLQLSNAKMLCTGGGAFNTFLIEELQRLLPAEIVVPDKQTVQFKEALAMALMGVLRLRNEVNVFNSVTNATRNTVNGAVYFA